MVDKRNLVSPKMLLQEAKKQMLNNCEPNTKDDWMTVLNFMAANIAPEVQPSALKVIAMIYQMPVSPEEVETISMFQMNLSKEPATAAKST